MDETWMRFLETRGARTAGTKVLDFGRPDEELRAAASGSIVAPLASLALLQAAGDDAREFLHGQFSCDVKGLAPDRSTFGSYNTPKGRMLASFVLWHETAGYQVALSESIRATILKRLQMFVLRSKVKITDRSAERVLLGAAGPAAAAAVERACGIVPAEVGGVHSGHRGAVVRLGATRFLIAAEIADADSIWSALAETLTPVGTPAWDWLEITSGIPFVTAATQDQLVPQMANLELIGGVSFNKGCYPGQEIVARTQYLGKLKRRMYLAKVNTDAAPQAGDPLYGEDVGEQANGLIVNAAPAPDGGFDVLAVVQSASVEGSRVHVGGPQGPLLQFRPLPYAVQ
jgi:hypothetical protein